MHKYKIIQTDILKFNDNIEQDCTFNKDPSKLKAQKSRRMWTSQKASSQILSLCLCGILRFCSIYKTKFSQ